MDKSASIDNDDKSSLVSPIMESTSPKVFSQLKDEFDNEDTEIQNAERKDETKFFNKDFRKETNNNMNRDRSINISATAAQTTHGSGPQIFVVRPLPSRSTPNNETNEPSTTSEKHRVNDTNSSNSSGLHLRKGIPTYNE